MQQSQTESITIIDKFALPGELLTLIKNYVFPNKIPKTDERYTILSNIPPKEYDETDNVTYVYMRINAAKDYYMTFTNSEIQLQTLLYDDDTIHFIEGHITTL